MAVIETKGITVDLGGSASRADVDIRVWTVGSAGKNCDKPGVVINVHDDNGYLFEVLLTKGALYRAYMASIDFNDG